MKLVKCKKCDNYIADNEIFVCCDYTGKILFQKVSNIDEEMKVVDCPKNEKTNM